MDGIKENEKKASSGELMRCVSAGDQGHHLSRLLRTKKLHKREGNVCKHLKRW